MNWTSVVLESIMLVAFEVFLLFYFVRPKKPKRKKVSEFLVYLCIVGIILVMLWNRQSVAIRICVIFLMSTLLMHKLYRVPIRKMCVDVALYEFSLLLGETFTLVIFSFIGRKYLIEPCYGGMKIRIEIIILTKVISFFILFFVKKSRGLSGKKLNRQELVSMFLPIISSMMVLYIISIIVIESDEEILKNDYRLIGVVFLAIVFSSICSLLISQQYIKVKEEEYRDKMRILQIESQYHYFTERQKDEKNVQRMYHDLKNHLLVLQKEACATAETGEYISAMLTNIKPYENYYETGNRFLNIIINEKIKQAKEHKINMDVLLEFTNMEAMEPMDISTLFGNALDNAIEASCKIKEEKRYILVKARWHHDNMVIKVENNHNNKLVFVQGKIMTTKGNKKMHGFGTENIKMVVEKYGGKYKVISENDKFLLVIILPKISCPIKQFGS